MIHLLDLGIEYDRMVAHMNVYIYICAIPLRNLLRDRRSSDRRQDLIRRLFVRLRNKDVRQVDLGSDLCPAMPFSLERGPIIHGIIGILQQHHAFLVGSGPLQLYIILMVISYNGLQ